LVIAFLLLKSERDCPRSVPRCSRRATQSTVEERLRKRLLEELERGLSTHYRGWGRPCSDREMADCGPGNARPTGGDWRARPWAARWGAPTPQPCRRACLGGAERRFATG